MQLMQQLMQALLNGEMKPQQAVAPTESTLLSELNGRMSTFTFDPDMLHSMLRSPSRDRDGRWCITC
ncbi:hypothetical protein Y032_0192g1374 [Ancylostoma ceylanicum]|nr:hypothetical protein Y032_0192g1374 [Ancylostoma ceylanicum]